MATASRQTAPPVAPAENGMEKVGGGRGEGGGRIARTVDKPAPTDTEEDILRRDGSWLERGPSLSLTAVINEL